MKFSEKWLREWVNPPVDSHVLADQLTSLGLEVDSVVSASPGFEKVTVARIVSIKPHPDADRLKVCEVDFGNSDLEQVVCGAPNARAGLITAFAQVGGRLPDGTKLKKAKLRGVVSMGMLCSARELGLSEDGSGIMELPNAAPVGTSLAHYLELDDSIVEVELTPDRADCLSIRGIARDLSAKNDLPLQLREINAAPLQTDAQCNVMVDDTSACVRYTGRVVRDLVMPATSPVWMAERLRRAGVRAINPAVDITNYVMLELGQPMHAFDMDKLQGGIQVRLAHTGEGLVLLDGRELLLDDDTTVIADDRGAIGIAGIMGGLSTAVDENTKNVFFESALFLPELIAGKPRRYSSHTESAHRFERGVDPSGQIQALEYATGLLRTIAGGKAGPVTECLSGARLPARHVVTVRRSRVERVLGINPEPELVEKIFTRLGIVSEVHEEGWKVTAPSYRYDLLIEEDYLGEVARILGYDSLPRTFPSHQPRFRAVPETDVSPVDVKNRLVSRGYQEVVTFSFVEAGQQQMLRPDLHALPLANPISSELGVMRTTLIGGLISTLQRNLARQIPSLAVFETGLRFLANPDSIPLEKLDVYLSAGHGLDQQCDESVQQQSMLAGLIAGRRYPENWNNDAAEAGFFDLKADLESLFEQANGGNVVFVPTDLDLLHPGQRAGITVDRELVGYIGALNPALVAALDLSVSPMVFEVSLQALCVSRVPRAAALSRFPQVRRDISLLVDTDVSYQSIVDVVRAEATTLLRDVRLFDVYDGDKLPDGKKSIALGLILQEFSRTLEDAEVERVVATVVSALGATLGAVLRV